MEYYIPDVTIRRLPAYLRLLGELEDEHAEIVSSAEMSRRTGFSSEQIRKDLAYFGAFGTRGVGYRVDFLQERLRKILGLDGLVAAALVGAGKLGQSLARYVQSQHRSIRISHIFDIDEDLVGQTLAGVTIMHTREMEETVAESGVRLAVVAVPAPEAQEVVDSLARAGVRAILNFAPVFLKPPQGVVMKSVDLSSEMRSLVYYARKCR
ncbi:MAG: redox-sensing transcriptional repressor Rex [Bacillota bacterium]